MPLTGTHIACGFAGGSGKRGLTMPVVVKPAWSQTMASAGTTTNAAPSGGQEAGDPIFTVYASAAIYVAIAGTPDASSGARLYIAANEEHNIYCDPGDKLAWILA